MEDVRAPMVFKRERLVEPLVVPNTRRGRITRSSMKEEDDEIAEGILNIDIENALIQSLLDIQEEENRKRIEEEEKRLKTLMKFDNIRHQMKRIGMFDKDIQELSLLMEPIIEQYSENTTHVFSFDKEIYGKIMKNIKSIRLKKEEVELIYSMIQCE